MKIDEALTPPFQDEGGTPHPGIYRISGNPPPEEMEDFFKLLVKSTKLFEEFTSSHTLTRSHHPPLFSHENGSICLTLVLGKLPTRYSHPDQLSPDRLLNCYEKNATHVRTSLARIDTIMKKQARPSTTSSTNDPIGNSPLSPPTSAQQGSSSLWHIVPQAPPGQ